MKRLRVPVELASNSAVQTSHRVQRLTLTLRLARGSRFIFNTQGARQNLLHLLRLNQEAVMAVVRLDNIHGDRGGQRLRQTVRLVREEQAIRVHRRNRPLAIGVRQRLRQGAAATRHIVRNQCLVHCQVAIRVKALNQLGAVVVQVAFDGVAATRLTQRAAHGAFATVLFAAEAVLQLGGAAVGGVRNTACQGKTGQRRGTVIVVATGKVRVRTNRNILPTKSVPP